MKRKLIKLFFLSAGLLVTFGMAYLVVDFEAETFPPFGSGRVIEVYVPGGTESLARVSVSKTGVLGLEIKGGGNTALLRRTLSEARIAGSLPLKSEEAVTIGGKSGRGAEVVEVAPEDPRYPWAVLDLLRRRGLDCSMSGG